MKKIIFIAIMLFCYLQNNAQQDPMFTKYMFNSLVYNPAYAGSHVQYGTATLAGRKQWIGFDGSPTAILAGVESSISDGRMGLGLTIGYDAIGINGVTDIYGHYAYRFQAGSGLLGIGIRGGVSIYKTAVSKVDVLPGDPVFDQGDYTLVTPNAGFGIYWNTQKFYAGLALPTLLAYDKKNGFYSTLSDSTFLDKHLYFHTGGLIGKEDADIQFEPSLLLKYQHAAPLQATIGLSVWFVQKFAIGCTYRVKDAIAVTAEVYLSDSFRIGAAYDFTTSRLRKHSHGTGEIMLGYRFRNNRISVGDIHGTRQF